MIDYAFSAGWEEPEPSRPAPMLPRPVEETRAPARVQGPAGGTSRRRRPGPASPLEAGTGACPQPGCISTGAHVHRPDPATGRREIPTSRRRREAGEWTRIDWLTEISRCGWSQARALAELRRRIEAEGGRPPERLADVPGNPHLVAVLLDVIGEPTRGGRPGV